MATITFDNIQSGSQTAPTYTYSEAGFTFGPVQASSDTGRVFGITDSAGGAFVYTSNSLSFENGNAQFISGTIKASDGSRFTPSSVQINQARPTAESASIRFSGSRNGNPVSFQDVGVDNDPNTIQTVNLGSFLSDIDTLTVTIGSGQRQIQFDNFVINPVCYASGTSILTSRGNVVVENLIVGDLAVTASGQHRPISWIGHRTVDCARHPRPSEVMPVRIGAGAFGENRPARDLVVSPGHAICLDLLGEVLIPASALVNGTTITQQDVDSVTYWHVELDSHDILIAEGQPAESYRDMGNRNFFAESGVVDLGALPDADAISRSHADFCRPYVDGGVVLDAVRAQVHARAERGGWRLDDAPWAGMHLMVDGVRIEAETDALAARFVLPASAQDVWLVSDTSAPRDIGLNADPRRLGLCLRALTIGDGFGETRSVGLNDPRLSLGFHHAEGVQRWTAGRSRLPADLFAGCRGTATLRLELARPALPRWIAPEAVVVNPAEQYTPRLSYVA